MKDLYNPILYKNSLTLEKKNYVHWVIICEYELLLLLVITHKADHIGFSKAHELVYVSVQASPYSTPYMRLGAMEVYISAIESL